MRKPITQEGQDLGDRIDALSAILLVLINSLERTSGLTRTAWIRSLEDLSWTVAESGGSFATQAQLYEIIKTFRECPANRRRRPKLDLISGGLDGDPKNC